MDECELSLSELIKDLKLETVYMPESKKELMIKNSDINRPALQIAGYFSHFDETRIQIFGMVEHDYLMELDEQTRRNNIDRFFSFSFPCLIITRNMEVPDDFIELAKIHEIPLLRTEKHTSSFSSRAIYYMNAKLGPQITRHGVLVEVYGEGILILGDSGVGKSETAIELVKRGHRLIADDAVEIKKVSPHELVGSAPPVLKHYIELRGIGVINVAKLFGMGAVKESSNIDLIINMVPWRDGEAYDRLGMETQYTEILDVKVPSITVPITPGRNLAVIFEVAAMNNRQKRMGYNAAVEFTEQMSKYFTSRNDD